MASVLVVRICIVGFEDTPTKIELLYRYQNGVWFAITTGRVALDSGGVSSRLDFVLR